MQTILGIQPFLGSVEIVPIALDITTAYFNMVNFQLKFQDYLRPTNYLTIQKS